MRVLVLAGDGDPPASLARALGPERASRVRRLLVARARAWAAAAFGADVVSLEASGSLAGALTDDGAGRRRAGADGRRPGAGHAGAGPAAPGGWPADGGTLVAIRPELPAWHPELAPAVRDDLAAGCGLALGPIFDGGLYLLAVAEGALGPNVLRALDLSGPAGLGDLIALARREHRHVGLLRSERGLRRERDVRALLADPLTDPELRVLLR
ncbi:MAG TPA: hypothetical protein VKV21_07240 [Solirubrobacteraceae bacterium]|nr:hypothetical protein [Solirubrobacteraceae bacterium]